MPPSTSDIETKQSLAMDSASPVKISNPSNHSNNGSFNSTTTVETSGSSSAASLDFGDGDGKPTPSKERQQDSYGDGVPTPKTKYDYTTPTPKAAMHVSSRRDSLIGRVMGWNRQPTQKSDVATPPSTFNGNRRVFGSWARSSSSPTLQQTFPSGFRRQSSLGTMMPRTDSENSLRSYRSEENDEIWDLLNQSRSRIAETTAREQGPNKKTDYDDDDDDDLSTIASNAAGEMIDQSIRSTVSSVCEDDEDSIVRLLNRSKQRLDKEEGNSANDRNVSTTTIVTTTKKKKNHNCAIPDEKESEEDVLTQKELVIAMAKAEEAARTGKDTFETPSAELLRKEEEQKELLLAMEAAEEAAKFGVENFKLIAKR